MDNMPEVVEEKRGKKEVKVRSMVNLGVALGLEESKFLSEIGGNLDSFKINRPDLYANDEQYNLYLQALIRRQKFNKKSIKKLSNSEAIRLYEILGRDQRVKYEQERLERGQSTENVNLIVQAIKEAKKRKKESKLSTLAMREQGEE